MKINKLFSFILSIAVIFASVFSAFPGVTASASTIELADSDYENALNVMKSICPDYPLSDGEVTTRAEFVAAMTMALNMPAGVSLESAFTDVDKKDKYASNIAYAANLGIISNVALFYPDTKLTYAQAIKIVMSAAGYDKKAEFSGGFPTGYLKAANEADVGKGLNLGNDEPVSHEIATRLIFEACCTDMMEATSFGSSYNYTVTEGKNILSVYHDIYMVEGVVEANENTGLTSISAALANDYIAIDGVNYLAPDCENLIGKKARILYRDDNKKTVIYAYENGNTAVSYTGEDGPVISDTDFTAYPMDSNKEMKHSLEDDYTVIYNGKCYIASDFNSVIVPESGTVTLVDNDDNRAFDVIIVRNIEYGVIGSINAPEGKIYDKYKKNALIDLSDNDTRYSVKASDGTVLTLENLEVGDTIGYAASHDKKVYEIIRYTDEIGGTYDQLTSDGKIVLKNQEYKLSSYYIENVKALKNLKLGTEVILRVSSDNKVIYITEYSSSLNYAFLVDVGTGTGLDSAVKVKIFSQTGEMLELDLAEKVRFDTQTKTLTSELKSELDAVLAKQYAYRVIKYSLNAEGKVNKIYTATDNTESTNVLFKHPVDEARPVIYYDSTEVSGEIPEEGTVPYVIANTLCPFHSRGAFTPYFHAGSGSKIMQIPVRPSQFNDDENFRIRSSVSDDYYRVAAYDVKQGGLASFVLISNDSSAGSIGKYDSSAIIESITEGVNEDGEVVTILKLYYGGEWNKYYYDPEFTKITAENTGGDGTSPQTELTIADFAPGDIIRISADGDNLISEMTMNFDCSKKEVVSKLTQTTNNNGRYVEYIKGYALSYSDSRLALATGLSIEEIVSADGVVDISNTYSGTFTRGTTLFVKLHRNRSTKAVESAEIYKEENTNGIETYFNAGSNADYVVLRQYFRDPSLNVIYVNIDD